MAKKQSGSNMSMGELLSALTLAQKERDTTMEELKKITEGERKRAELAEQRSAILQKELDQVRSKNEELNLKCQELENTLKMEKEKYGRNLEKTNEEFGSQIKVLKETLIKVQHSFNETERVQQLSDEELIHTKDKLHKASILEDNLKEEIKKLKEELRTVKDELSKSLKNQEVSDSELHMSKMQLLKENNINNRLLDELKRTRKDIDEYKEEIEKHRKSKDRSNNNISKQIKELSILVSENNIENFDDHLREIRISLSTILKENFLLNNKIHEVYKVLTKGDTEVVSIAIQTNIGFGQMFNYENMDREVTNVVMRLREELVTNKSDMIELKQQNEAMKSMIRDMKREKERNEFVEEEEVRVEKLEDAVRSLKEMLQQEDEKQYSGERAIVETLEKMRKDLNMLKGHVTQTVRHDNNKRQF